MASCSVLEVWLETLLSLERRQGCPVCLPMMILHRAMPSFWCNDVRGRLACVGVLHQGKLMDLLQL